MRPRSPSPLGRAAGAAIACAAFLSASTAAARPTEPDYQQWHQLLVDAKLPSRFLASLDAQSRRMDAPLFREKLPDGTLADRPNPSTTLLIRPAFGYAITPNVSAFVGYVWQPIFFDDPAVRAKKNVDEHRIFEQVSTSFALGSLTLGTRTRLEQRVRLAGPGSPDADLGLSSWAHRVRQQVRLDVPLGEGSALGAVIWDEVFFHLNETAYPTEPGFDQNRAFLGLAVRATPELRAELGYLSQYVHRFADDEQLNHVLLMTLGAKFSVPDESTGAR